MSNGRIEYAVSCTPIYTIEATSESSAVDVIAKDVNRQLGESGQTEVTWGTTIGYADGSPIYTKSSGNSQRGASLGLFTSIKFLYIKHTGRLFITSSLLGAETEEKLVIHYASSLYTADAIVKELDELNASYYLLKEDGVSLFLREGAFVSTDAVTAVLNPYESILLPFASAQSPVLYIAPETSAIIAVEVMATS